MGVCHNCEPAKLLPPRESKQLLSLPRNMSFTPQPDPGLKLVPIGPRCTKGVVSYQPRMELHISAIDAYCCSAKKDTMPAIKLGDTASVVRDRCGISADYHSAWKSLNVEDLSSLSDSRADRGEQNQAQAVCSEVCRNVSLNQADTAPAIAQLRTFYSSKPRESDITWRKIQDALEVDGAAAWIIHNAVKRNYERYKRGSYAVLLHLSMRAKGNRCRQAEAHLGSCSKLLCR